MKKINTFALLLFIFSFNSQSQNIQRGENRNRTLTNTNIVTNKTIEKNAKGISTITTPTWVNENDELAIIGYTQNNRLQTTGATQKFITK